MIKKLLSWLFLISVFLSLVGLGFWQLQRAQYKEVLIQQYEARRQNTSLDLEQLVHWNEWSATEQEQRLFSKVVLTGYFDFQHPIVLLNKIHEHQLGFYILMPFIAEGLEKPVLINLGWLPHPAQEGDRKTLHRYQELPSIPAMPGVKTIIAYLGDAHPGWTVGPAIAGEISWPLPMVYLDWSAVESAYQHPLYHGVLLLGEEEAFGFIRLWHPVTMPSARHTAYAVQWFLLAVVWLVLIGIFKVRQTKRKQ